MMEFDVVVLEEISIIQILYGYILKYIVEIKKKIVEIYSIV